MQNQQGDVAKLLIIGDSGVGKTNILLRFCENHFMQSHMTTIGIDFKIKTIEVNGKKIRMQIWDTAGQERFKTITQTYYKGAMGIVLTYAINDMASFQSLQNWLKQVKTHADENVVKIIMANKSDSDDRKITTEQGKALAKDFGVDFFQVSAKDGTNINDAFFEIAKKIQESFFSQQKTSEDVQRSRLGKGNSSKSKSCCLG